MTCLLVLLGCLVYIVDVPTTAFSLVARIDGGRQATRYCRHCKSVSIASSERRLNTGGRLYQQREVDCSTNDDVRIRKSAFGKAAIGRTTSHKKLTLLRDDSGQQPPFPNVTKHETTVRSKNDIASALMESTTVSTKERAVSILKCHLQALPFSRAHALLSSHPSLYTRLTPSQLSTRLSYLLNEMNIPSRQLIRMLNVHPALMTTVFLDDTLSQTTLRVLQMELQWSQQQIEQLCHSHSKLLHYPRTEIRKRIQVYKHHLHYSTREVQLLVAKDPRMLRTNAQNVKRILDVLREELGMDRENVRTMVDKEILVLTYRAEENIRRTVRWLVQGDIGSCLGEDRRNHIKKLVMGHPKILSASVEKNLKPTVSFFLEYLGVSPMEFQRILHRRGGSLLEANVDRTLKKKVDFLRHSLGLSYTDDTTDNNNSSTEHVPLPALYKALTSHEKRRLLAQTLATSPDILTLSMEHNLAPKFTYFRENVGMTVEELRHVVLSRPQLLTLSLEQNLIPKIDFFRNNDGNMMMMSNKQLKEWIVHYPQTLALSLHSKIKPRVHDAIDVFGPPLSLDVPENAETNHKRGAVCLPMNFISRTDASWAAWKKKTDVV